VVPIEISLIEGCYLQWSYRTKGSYLLSWNHHFETLKSRQHNGQKKKNERTNNDLQNIIQKTKDRATRNPLKMSWNQVLRMGKQFLLHVFRPSIFMIVHMLVYCISKTQVLQFRLIVNTIIRSCPHSWLIIRFVARITRRVEHVEQELFTHPEHRK
jgi:hypothetical protein